MAKLHKKVRTRENSCSKLHSEMNMKAGPTRLEPVGSYPVYYIPDLDPMQDQINRIETAVNYEARCARRRAWKASVAH